jgi:hypothetical protein
MEDQGLAAESLVVLHLADLDQVVAPVMDGHGAAHEPGDRAVDQRRPVRAVDAGHAGELVAGGSGELPGQVMLVRGEDVDGEPSGVPEHRRARRPPGTAPQDQRRVEGDGGERVRGHSDLVALRAPGGDDGDTGGEFAEGSAEIAAAGPASRVREDGDLFHPALPAPLASAR